MTSRYEHVTQLGNKHLLRAFDGRPSVFVSGGVATGRTGLCASERRTLGVGLGPTEGVLKIWVSDRRTLGVGFEHKIRKPVYMGVRKKNAGRWVSA